MNTEEPYIPYNPRPVKQARLKWVDRRGLTLSKLSVLRELPLFDVESLLLYESAIGEVCENNDILIHERKALRLLPILDWLEDLEGHVSAISLRIVLGQYDRSRASDADVLYRHGILELVKGKHRLYSKTNIYRLTEKGRKLHHTLISTYGNLRADLLSKIFTNRHK